MGGVARAEVARMVLVGEAETRPASSQTRFYRAAPWGGALVRYVPTIMSSVSLQGKPESH